MKSAEMIRRRGLKKAEPKYKAIKRYLKGIIQEMEPGKNRLETEEVLSNRLQVSKATLRQAMDELISDDLITRQQGRGVFGHPRVSTLKMNLGGFANFRDYLSRGGYRVSVSQSSGRVHKASGQMVRRVPEIAGQEVFGFDWTYYANDRPAIICRVEIPMELAVHTYDKDVPPLTLKESVKSITERDFAYAISWIRAAGDSEAARVFSLDTATAFLVWDENFYDISDYHLCYNEILFHPEILDFSIICHF